jgi:hypothetical protein
MDNIPTRVHVDREDALGHGPVGRLRRRSMGGSVACDRDVARVVSQVLSITELI